MSGEGEREDDGSRGTADDAIVAAMVAAANEKERIRRGETK